MAASKKKVNDEVEVRAEVLEKDEVAEAQTATDEAVAQEETAELGAALLTGPRFLVTVSRGLNLREGPGKQYPILAVLPMGAEVLVSGESEDGRWLPVSSAKGDGWVMTKYLALMPLE